MILRYLTILTLAIVLAATIHASPAPAALRPDLMGLVVRDPWYDYDTNPAYPAQPNYTAQDRMGVTLAELGVRWVRFEFRIEGSDVFSATQLARYDYFIRSVAPRHNLKVLGLLGFGLVADRSPFDLRATDTITNDHVYGGGVNDYMRTWLDRARFVTERYAGSVHAYEILNEQNRLPPSGDGIPATISARLHTKFYRFFRNIDRAHPGDQSWRDGVQIIIGGLHPAGTFDPGAAGYISDRDYLLGYYQSDGFTSYKTTYGRFPADGLGYHPYPLEIRASLQNSLELMGARIQELRDLLASAAVGDPLLPLWITEIGYNVGYPGQPLGDQSAFLRAVYELLGARADVATIFWFKYEDFPTPPGGPPQQWGLVRIPFTSDARCPGGACYDLSGAPEMLRSAFWTYRELAGLPVERYYMPLVAR